VLVEVSPEFFRPTDVVTLLGCPQKARQELGWNPGVGVEEGFSRTIRSFSQQGGGTQ